MSTDEKIQNYDEWKSTYLISTHHNFKRYFIC